MIHVLGAAFVFASLLAGWQYNRANNLQEANAELKVVAGELQEANKQFAERIREATNQVKEQNQTIQEAFRLQQETMNRTLAVSQQLDKLRSRERQRAILQPFETGNSATARRNAIFMRLDETRDSPGSSAGLHPASDSD